MILLLIDDDDDDVLFFSDALREIYPAADLHRYARADKALEKINGKEMVQPDIIFIDINMPVINGWECLRQIRTIAGWQGIPSIIYSSASPDHILIPADIGTVTYYQKSDSFDELTRQLKQVISSILPGIDARK